METLTPDDASLLAMAASRMTTLSIAQTMGPPWTEAKVYNRLAKLKCRVEREEAPARPAPLPLNGRRASFVIADDLVPAPKISAPAPVAKPAPEPRPARRDIHQARVFGPHSTAPAEAIEPRRRAGGPSPYDTSHPRPCAVALVEPPHRRIERLKPLTAARLRYARWFLAAEWPVGEVARLFGLDAEALERAA